MKKYNKELSLKKLKALNDEDIDTTDIPELDAAFWKNAQLMQSEKEVYTSPAFEKKLQIRVY